MARDTPRGKPPPTTEKESVRRSPGTVWTDGEGDGEGDDVGTGDGSTRGPALTSRMKLNIGFSKWIRRSTTVSGRGSASGDRTHTLVATPVSGSVKSGGSGARLA